MDPWTEAVVARLEERLAAATALHERNEEIERLARQELHRTEFVLRYLREAIQAMKNLKGGTGEGVPF